MILMVKKYYNLEKHKHIVRDIYTGKIITAKEAVSVDNIELMFEKEGYIQIDEKGLHND